MIFSLLTTLRAYLTRRNTLKAAHRLQRFSIRDKRLFEGEIIAAGGGRVDLRTCAIDVGDGSLVQCRVHFERDGSFLKVGMNSFVGASDLVISTGITIGDNVLISHGCMIQDHDSHSTEAAIRRKDVKAWVEGRHKDWSTVRCQEIVIKDDVWIGARAVILKGVRIGRAAIVGAGAVVTRDVAPTVTVAGNPAKAVRSIPDQ